MGDLVGHSEVQGDDAIATVGSSQDKLTIVFAWMIVFKTEAVASVDV